VYITVMWLLKHCPKPCFICGPRRCHIASFRCNLVVCRHELVVRESTVANDVSTEAEE
jgi:hypothetical protein